MSVAALLTACGVPTTPDASRDSATSEDAAEAAAPLDGGEDSGCGAGTQRACYSGPAGTSGVGVCRPGVQRCFEGAWGPCVGEATPASEVCGNGADDDCNGTVDCPADAGPEGGDARFEAGLGPCADADGDGYGIGSGCRGPDCNDAAPEVHPGALERCDGRDSDCDGMSETAANAMFFDVDCVGSSPIPADERLAYSAYPPRCAGPGRQVVSAPYPPRPSFACQACRMIGADLSCLCWRRNTAGGNDVDNCRTLP